MMQKISEYLAQQTTALPDPYTNYYAPESPSPDGSLCVGYVVDYDRGTGPLWEAGDE